MSFGVVDGQRVNVFVPDADDVRHQFIQFFRLLEKIAA